MKKIGLFYATKAERTSWVAEKIFDNSYSFNLPSNGIEDK